MRPTLFRLCLFVVLLWPLPGIAQQDAPDPVGFWAGALVQHGAVQLLSIDITDEAEGLVGRFTVPDWGVLEQPQSLTLDGDTLRFAVLYGRFALHVDDAAGTLRGRVTQRNGSTLAVQLNRTLRPATPAVTTEEVRFPSGDVTIAGTLVLPASPGPHPAIVIVAGRSYGQRWGNYGDALRLARRGVACLIFDGRGTGDSGGDRALTTAEDRYRDAQGALDLLLVRDDIDPNQVGLWGISAGGWVIPEVARRSGRVAFLILDVGPAVGLAEQQGHVVSYRMRWFAEEPFTEADYAAAYAYQKRLVELSWEDAGWETFEPLVAEARSQSWAGYVDLPENLDNAELDYFRRRKHFDAGPALRETTIPVLAVYGGRDFIVPPDENVPVLEALLREAGNTDTTIRVFPEANHSMVVPGGMQGEGPDAAFHWPRRAPGIYETLYGWIAARVRPAATP